MKKRLLQVIAFVCVTVTSFLLCSCGKKPDSGNNVDVENIRAEHKVTNSLHKGVEDIPDTGKPFIVDGASEYKIVASNYGSHKNAVAKAAGFISSHINSATGVALEVIDGDSDIEWSSSAKLVVVGSEKLQQAAGFRKTADDIGLTGYQIQTVGNSVFVWADGDNGYNLAALALLRVLVGYDCLDLDTYIYTKDGSYLPEMDIVERPDFDYRVDQTLYTVAAPRAYSMGFNQGEPYMTADPCHTSFYFLPPKVYESENKDWFSNQRCNFVDDQDNYLVHAAQLCYTAHGKPEELKKMQELIADQIMYLTLEKYPDRNLVTVGQQDEDVVCNCDSCTAVVDKYGSIAAAIIPFINGIDDIVQSRLKAYAEEHNQPVKETNILFLSYQSTRFAPKFDDSLKFNDHVGVLICSSKTRYSYTFWDDINVVDKEQTEKWQPFGNVYYFYYEINSNNYFVPCNTFRACVENYRFAKINNGRLMTSMGNWKTPYTSSFTAFKSYLNSRLWFNVNYDYVDLEKTFFDNYYGDGGVYMKKFFDEMTSYMDYMRDSGNADFNGVVVNEFTYTAKYWPIKMLQRWNNYCDLALKEIEKTKALNDGTYEALHDRILLETLFPRYIICKYHAAKFSETEIASMRKAFYEDTQYFNLTHESQYETFESLWKVWGLK